MVDITILASSAITALVPYLTKGGEAIADEAGKNLFSWIKSHFQSVSKEKDLQLLEEKPDDAKIQGRTEMVLENILTNNPAFVQELTKLLERAEKETISVIASKNVVNAPISAGGNGIVGDNNHLS